MVAAYWVVGRTDVERFFGEGDQRTCRAMKVEDFLTLRRVE